jgi:hypothetical protein
MRAERFQCLQHVLDMIERMVETAWLGIMLANILENLLSRDQIHGPSAEKITPCSAQRIVRMATPAEQSLSWRAWNALAFHGYLPHAAGHDACVRHWRIWSSLTSRNTTTVSDRCSNT